MKICLVGGSGFIGTNLCVRLLSFDHEISILDQRASEYLQRIDEKRKISWFIGDFSDRNLLFQALSGCDVLFHLASNTIPGSVGDDPIFDIERNLITSINLIKIANEVGVAHIIYVSSGGTVYGIPENIPIDEKHTQNPICSYGINKLAVEKYLRLFNHAGGASYTIFRLSNPYGPFQNPYAAQGVIPVFMNKILLGEKITIWGDGEVVRDFIYIDDVIDVFLDAMNRWDESAVYNLGSGTGRSINDVLCEISKLCNKDTIIEYEPSRSIDVPINVLNISAITKAYEWSPKVSLDIGLTATMGYLKTL